MTTAAVITVSDRCFVGAREDKSGPLLEGLLAGLGLEVTYRAIVMDEREQIEALLCDLADNFEIDLIVTTGGTGAAPRDVTPEATKAVIDREMPGLAELLRMEGYKVTPFAVLSRGVAGIRKGSLIINLAGNPRAVREGMEILGPLLPHALQMVEGIDLDHG